DLDTEILWRLLRGLCALPTQQINEQLSWDQLAKARPQLCTLFQSVLATHGTSAIVSTVGKDMDKVEALLQQKASPSAAYLEEWTVVG
ncbi:unnamed protein product, partial [Effrenium voratum]